MLACCPLRPVLCRGQISPKSSSGAGFSTKVRVFVLASLAPPHWLLQAANELNRGTRLILLEPSNHKAFRRMVAVRPPVPPGRQGAHDRGKGACLCADAAPDAGTVEQTCVPPPFWLDWTQRRRLSNVYAARSRSGSSWRADTPTLTSAVENSPGDGQGFRAFLDMPGCAGRARRQGSRSGSSLIARTQAARLPEKGHTNR